MSCRAHYIQLAFFRPGLVGKRRWPTGRLQAKCRIFQRLSSHVRPTSEKSCGPNESQIQARQ